MKAAILGTTGYTGSILLRLLYRHPEVEALLPVSSSRAGESVLQTDPGLGEGVLPKLRLTDGRLVSPEKARDFKPDVVFSALPHLKSAELCSPFFKKCVVIDLSADFRIKDVELFAKAYGEKPSREDLLGDAVYGLCEWNTGDIKTADIIANPGCYPTATLLPLLPLASQNQIEGDVIINAISGISGAGRKLSENLLYCERTENTTVYLPGTSHRHWAEIADELWMGNRALKPYFTPHMAPLKRGISVTTYARLTGGATEKSVRQALSGSYAGRPFVRLKEETLPQTLDVWGSNRCDIGWRIEDGSIFLFSVIDNLMKGASGQAVQNMNLRFGLDERMGLPEDNIV
ncbi:MAG TPA: N-acetyl-gamma-glutamyl-phosphate reductase [Spirochaetia bacterium]|nr:N-acetyl-gamma-glutamyl-phosphate reductase [Spirochaetia bacterium]